MEVLSKRKIKDGSWYKRLVPRPEGGNILVKPNATVGDTLKFIPEMVRLTMEDTRELASHLKGRNLKETSRSIWKFVVDHIRYNKDRKGKEEVRRPSRTLHEQVGDCDCMSALVSSILSNLGIAHLYRVTKYMGRKMFQHIYVIVPKKGGGYFTIDPVVDGFDYEEPFTDKKDIQMDLHYLNGPVLAEDELYEDSEIDFEDAVSDSDLLPFEDEEEDMDGLGRRRRGGRRRGGGRRPTGRKKKKKKKPKGECEKRGLHAINRFNPATVLLRSGILAAAKLDIPRRKVRGQKGKVSFWGKLKLAYLDRNEAQRRGYNMANWEKMMKVRQRLEKIFCGAGGKPSNLKKALLKGKANRDGEVPVPAELRGIGATNFDLDFHEDSSLVEILGPDIYNEEIVRPQMAMNGLGGALGEVATGAAVTAAMTVLVSIAAMVGKVGDIKSALDKAKANRGGGGSGAPTGPLPSRTPDIFNPNQQIPNRTNTGLFPDGDTNFPLPERDDPGGNSSDDSATQRRTDDQQKDDENKPKKSFGEWFGSGGWMWFAGGAGVIGLSVLGYRAMRNSKKKKTKQKTSKSSAKTTPALAGVNGPKKKKGKSRRPPTSRRRPGMRPPRRGPLLPGSRRRPFSPDGHRRPTLAGILEGAKKKKKGKTTRKVRSKKKTGSRKSGKRKQVNLN